MSLWLHGPNANSLISRSQTLQFILYCVFSLLNQEFSRKFPWTTGEEWRLRVWFEKYVDEVNELFERMNVGGLWWKETLIE